MELCIKSQEERVHQMKLFIAAAKKWNSPADMAYLEQRLAEAQEVLDQIFWTACQG